MTVSLGFSGHFLELLTTTSFDFEILSLLSRDLIMLRSSKIVLSFC